MSTKTKIVKSIPTDKIPKTFYAIPTSNGGFDLNLTDETGIIRPLNIPSTENFLNTFKGKGSPEGKVEATYGSLYYDTDKTNGVISYLKTSNSGKNGWVVDKGDTGWNKRSDSTATAGSGIYFRRINNTVYVAFGGGPWDSYKLATANARPNIYSHVQNKSDGIKRIRLRMDDSGDYERNFIPNGFRTAKSVITSVFNDNGVFVGSLYIGSPDDTGVVYFSFKDRVPNSGNNDDLLRITPVSYLTNDPWPQYDLTPYKT